MDDGAYEEHGVSDAQASRNVALREGPNFIGIVLTANIGTISMPISPAEARYLAKQLTRLAKRIEARTTDTAIGTKP